MVYYGLTLNADALIPGNVYLNNVIGGLIEFPTYIMCIIILHYFGRRLPLALMFIFSGAMLFISLARPMFKIPGSPDSHAFWTNISQTSLAG